MPGVQIAPERESGGQVRHRWRDTDMTAAPVVVLNAAWAQAAQPTLTELVLVGGVPSGQRRGSG
jgi:hypothetical protein